MEKQYPTDRKIDFFVCEVIRQEAGGKLSILGYYPGNDINLNTLSTVPPQINIAVVYVLNDGFGEFDTKLLIGVPGEKEKKEIDLNILNKHPDKSHSVGMNISGFTAPRDGQYIFALQLDEKLYERNFHIHFPKEESEK